MSLRHLSVLLLLLSLTLPVRAQDPSAEAAQQATTTAAAAATVTGQVPPAPDFLEHLVDATLEIFNVRSSENTVTHYAIAALFLVAAVLLRRVVTTLIFGFLKKLAAKTETTLDDKLFPALEAPVATFIMLTGIFAALKVLKLTVATDRFIGYGSTVAFSLVVFWGLLRAFDAVLDHVQEIALQKQLGVAAFMPWIKKTLVTIFVVIGVLMVVQSLGFDVKALLAGLGIGGLAFALAAQDTIANLFGSIVVAIDQPFKLGETARIGAHTGTVEDIGLRSTKLRLVDKSLVILPNKLVSSEPIVNLSRFTARRVEQVFGLTYGAQPAQLEALVADIRGLLAAEPDLNPAESHVYFRDFSASSLDVWVVYVTKEPDFTRHMMLRQKLNLAIMRAVEARGLAFAFPTQTVHVATLPERKG
jgi:MscS family membrane protein